MFSMEHLLKGSWGFPWGPFCGDFNQNTVPPSWRLNANSKKHQPINQPKRLICFCLRPSANPYHNFNIKAFKQNVIKPKEDLQLAEAFLPLLNFKREKKRSRFDQTFKNLININPKKINLTKFIKCLKLLLIGLKNQNYFLLISN